MRKLGILGVVLALLVLPIPSQAAFINGTYTVTTSYRGGMADESVDVPFMSVWGSDVFWMSPLIAQWSPSAVLAGIDVGFQFTLGFGQDAQHYSGSLHADVDIHEGLWGMSWLDINWDSPLAWTFDNGDTLRMSHNADACFLGACSSTFGASLVPSSDAVPQRPSENTTAVPGPGVLTLFALAVGLLGAGGLVRRRTR